MSNHRKGKRRPRYPNLPRLVLKLELLGQRLLLSFPGEAYGLSTFESVEGAEQYLLAQATQQWDRHFDQQVCRLPDSGAWATASLLQAGDADQGFDFDQLDLVMVQVAGKVLPTRTWKDGILREWISAARASPAQTFEMPI